jgi:hypothetical protein
MQVIGGGRGGLMNRGELLGTGCWESQRQRLGSRGKTVSHDKVATAAEGWSGDCLSGTALGGANALAGRCPCLWDILTSALGFLKPPDTGKLSTNRTHPQPRQPKLGGGVWRAGEVYRGQTDYPLNGVVLWHCHRKDALDAPQVKAVEEFQEAAAAVQKSEEVTRPAR